MVTAQQVEAELQRRDENDALVAWRLILDAANAATGLSEPVADQGARDKLDSILAEILAGIDVTVDAAQVASMATPTGFALETTLQANNAALATILAAIEALQDDALTNTELRATPVDVDTGLTTQLDALTDAELRAAPLSVDTGLTTQNDALTDAELRAAPVSVDTGLSPQTDALTDAELRASPVPVSGPLSDAELRATPVEVSGTVATSNGQTDALTNTELRAAPVEVDTGLATQTDALTDAELRAAPVTVDTGLTPQTDALTDAELRASPVPVDTGLTPQTDALTDAELRASPVQVDTGLATQLDALTDAELRAAPVAVDTGLTPQTDALTDAELRAAPVEVTGDFGSDSSFTSTANSTSATSGTGWAGNTYTGAGEQNDFQYAVVSLTTDGTGTLYFDFSNDGVNWDSFPVNGFTIDSGIHEYHAAHKAGRYFRPRYVGNGSRTYFRLSTYYTDSTVALNSPMSQGIGDDSDAFTVKAVQFGKNPDGAWVDNVVTGTKTLSPTPTPLGASGEYTSASIDTELHPTLLLLFGADQPSANNGIQLCWSDTQSFTVTRSIEYHLFRSGNIAEGLFIQTRTRARWLRIKYTNGLSAQSRFFINLRMNPIPLVKDVTLASSGKAATGQQDVTLAASRIASSPLVGRKTIRVRNLSSSANPLFFGFSAGLTAANGDELSPGESIDLDIDEFVEVYVRATSTGGGGVRCAWTEIG